jgi:hypothetical protein
VKNGKVKVARIVSAFVIVLGGAAIQIALWKTTDRTYFDALTRHSYLWIVYLLFGLLVGEHCLRLMKREKKKARDRARDASP